MALSVTFIALEFAFSTSIIQPPASAQSLGARWVSANVPPFSLGAMTRLLDGKVISVGVTTQLNEQIRRVAIYDPLADSWRETTPMNYHRNNATSILLFDGRLLVVGGTKDEPSFQLPAGPPEIFVPSTEKWTEVQVQGSDTSPEFVNMWTRSNINYLPNGKVLVLSQIYNRAYLFDPMTGDAKQTSSPQTGIGNSFPSSTILRDGRILFLSNSFMVGPPTSAEIYDPETESWSMVDLPTSVDKTLPLRLAATLPDGKALGFFNTPIKQRVSLTFDPVAKSWGDITIRYSDTNSALTLPTGELFAFQYNVAEIYSTTSKSWRTVNSPTQFRFNSVLLASGQVYIGNEIYGVDFGSLTPRPSLTEVNTSAASFRVEPLARGSIVSLFGSNLMGMGGSSSSAVASDITPFNIIDGNGNVHQVIRVFTNTPNQINYLMSYDVPA